MEKVILHSDLNNFYASVECLHHPELRGKPLAVCGDAGLRHGIVLAKNYIAKGYGIKTGDVIFEAHKKAPGLVVISADFKKYLRFSKIVRHIYEDYTDQIESFGIDESWLDVTGEDGCRVANEIRERVKDETGCTVSIGVSYNKIFAKLGSDMKKTDAIMVITKDNYKDVVWKLPVEELMYVGKATKNKLQKMNVLTIGDLARTDINILKSHLDKWGEYLYIFANGYDTNPVMKNGEESLVKSVGNSTTTVRDLISVQDVRMVVTVLSESVALRLREQWLKGLVVSIHVRDKYLLEWGKQIKIDRPTNLSETMIDTAMQLFKVYDFAYPIRSIGVKVSDLCSADAPVQTDLLIPETERIKHENLEHAIDDIRRRFGHFSINRGIEYLDRALTHLDPHTDNTIHPISYFK